MISAEAILAKRSAFSRLAAPTLFAIAVIALSLVFADSYEPPSSTMRMLPTIPPCIATCGALTVVNLAIFVLWRRPGWWRFLNKYMLMSAGHPNTFSVLGNVFSHQGFAHLASNTTILFLVGSTVHEEVGRGTFIALYLISGVLGSMFSLYFNVLTRNFLSASIGNSNALYGLIGAYWTLSLKRKIGFTEYSFEYYSVIPLTLVAVAEFYAWRKMGKILPGGGGGNDHANHVGGLVAGATLGYYLRLRADRERKALQEFNAEREGELDVGSMNVEGVEQQ
jgi:rhomboid-like protein